MAFGARVLGTVATAMTGDLSPGLPAGVATGDKLICLCSTHDDNTDTTSMAAEWEPLYAAGHATVTTVGIYAWQTYYDAGAPPDTLISHSGSRALAVIVLVPADGVVTLDSLPPAPVSTASSLTINYPDADPEFANCLVIWHWSLGGTGAANGAISGTDPTPTEQLDQSFDTLHALGFADGINTSGTAIGARTSTVASGGANMGAVILLRETEAAVTGTATATIDEADIVAGGKTIIITLTGGTWIP